MKLKDVLEEIRMPGGGIRPMITEPMLENLQDLQGYTGKKVELAKELQDKCRSDMSYWSYECQKAYWTCVDELVQTALITGPDNLPNVPIPDQNGVIMDVCAKIMEFSRAILRLARAKEKK